jgi:hypothetical protein
MVLHIGKAVADDDNGRDQALGRHVQPGAPVPQCGLVSHVDAFRPRKILPIREPKWRDRTGPSRTAKLDNIRKRPHLCLPSIKAEVRCTFGRRRLETGVPMIFARYALSDGQSNRAL